GRAVLHGFRVEYHDIRPHSLGETAAIVQPESCGRLRGHLVYRLRQGEDAALANVPCEHSWEGAVPPWVRVSLARLREAAVGRNHRLGVPHDAVHVSLVEHVVDRRHAAALQRLQHQLGTNFRSRLQAALDGPVSKGAAFQVALPGYACELHAANVTAPAIVQDVEHSAAHDAVA